MHTQKTLTLGLGLATVTILLSACGGPSTPEPTEQAGLISGQVQPMRATTTSVTPVNAAVETPGRPFTTTVQANGNFDLNLPNSAKLNSSYATDLKTVKASYSYCDKSLVPDATFTTNAPDDMKMLQINELRSNDARQLVATTNDGTTFREWWYVDRDIQLTFTGTNCFFIGDINANLNLKKGWNVVEQTMTPVGEKVVTTFKLLTQPTTRTVYTDGSMTAQSNRSFNINMLRPWQNPANFK